MGVAPYAAHDAERAGKGGEYCDQHFEKLAPIELFHLGYRLWVKGYRLKGLVNLFASSCEP